VNTRQHIGRGIHRIYHPHQIREDIFPWKCDWTQVQSIWENGTDNEENGHTAAQKCCQPVKVSAVRKEKVCTGYGEKYEP